MLLDHKIAVIVPSTIGGEPAPAELIDYHVENALRSLAGVAGGATAEAGEGAWINDQGKLIRERVCTVYAYCTAAQMRWTIEAAQRVARDIKRSMSQEAVSIIVDNTMEFI